MPRATTVVLSFCVFSALFFGFCFRQLVRQSLLPCFAFCVCFLLSLFAFADAVVLAAAALLFITVTHIISTHPTSFARPFLCPALPRSRGRERAFPLSSCVLLHSSSSRSSCPVRPFVVVPYGIVLTDSDSNTLHIHPAAPASPFNHHHLRQHVVPPAARKARSIAIAAPAAPAQLDAAEAKDEGERPESADEEAEGEGGPAPHGRGEGEGGAILLRCWRRKEEKPAAPGGPCPCPPWCWWQWWCWWCWWW